MPKGVPLEPRELTEKQRRFAEAYDGNGTQASKDAGYSGNDGTHAVNALWLLRNPKIRAAIAEREEREGKRVLTVIATRKERQALWTKTMLDPSVSTKDRLKASELLGKSQIDFVEKLDVTARGTIQVVNPYATPAPVIDEPLESRELANDIVQGLMEKPTGGDGE
jgi:phage terminase small subunit